MVCRNILSGFAAVCVQLAAGAEVSRDRSTVAGDQARIFPQKRAGLGQARRANMKEQSAVSRSDTWPQQPTVHTASDRFIAACRRGSTLTAQVQQPAWAASTLGVSP